MKIKNRNKRKREGIKEGTMKECYNPGFLKWEELL
jgi:hypothetical protein